MSECEATGVSTGVSTSVNRSPGFLSGALDATTSRVIRDTFALANANAKLQFLDSARIRVELETDLERMEHLMAVIPTGQRSDARELMAELRVLASLVIAIAPSPTAAAVEQALIGQYAQWDIEAHAWIAYRHAT